MLKIQDRDFSSYLTEQNIKLPRTYKGEIQRTQVGAISAFPTSFITVGLDLAFIMPRDAADDLEQILLSSNLVDVIFTYKGSQYKGKFSATSTQTAEMHDKREGHKSLTISLVSDGKNITNTSGALFSIRVGTTVLRSNCSFGKVYTVANASTYYLNGAKVPLADNSSTTASILVLGDTVLTRNP